MSEPGRWLSVIGIGEDGPDGLSSVARALIAQASLVVAGRRHLALIAPIVKGATLAWPSPPRAAFHTIRARRGSAVSIVASGDPFFYGVGSLLAGEISPDEMLCIPAASSFGLAASRLGWAVQDCAAVTLHGRMLERIIPALQPRARILALAWDETTPGRLAALLTGRGLGNSRMIVCEALGGPRERLREATAQTFVLDAINPLNLVAIEIADAPRERFIPRAPGLPDDWFEHDGQMTKQDVRAMTLAALAPRQGELLWDIGAGSGSVAIEWMLSSPANPAIAIERDAVRAGRIARNAAALGVPGLTIVHGSAPESLAGLPQPHAVFIGGGATSDGTIDAAWGALPSGGRLVLNSVTIETQAELIHRYKSLGGSLKSIQIAHADPVGGFHGMRPSMPVTQWAVTKP